MENAYASKGEKFLLESLQKHFFRTPSCFGVSVYTLYTRAVIEK